MPVSVALVIRTDQRLGFAVKSSSTLDQPQPVLKPQLEHV
jgi:hypothetical protein